jgi:hypothetical protein
MGHDGGNPLKYQDYRVGLRALPLKPMECEKIQDQATRRENGTRTKTRKTVIFNTAKEDWLMRRNAPAKSIHLLKQLELHRCPHCSIAQPQLIQKWTHITVDHSKRNRRFWATYECVTCGGIVTAWGDEDSAEVIEMYPSTKQIDESIPDDAAYYLQQALECIHAPAGAIMLTASAVDAMLKVKGYTKGVLNSRIIKAAEDHLITDEMAVWAHEIRLDANAERHADQAATRPTPEDARRCIEFALALAEFLFVLPERVKRGRQSVTNLQNP